MLTNLAFEGAVAIFNGEECKGVEDIRVSQFLGGLVVQFLYDPGVWNTHEKEQKTCDKFCEKLLTIGIETGRLDMAIFCIERILCGTAPEFLISQFLDKYPLTKCDRVVDMIQFLIAFVHSTLSEIGPTCETDEFRTINPFRQERSWRPPV